MQQPIDTVPKDSTVVLGIIQIGMEQRRERIKWDLDREVWVAAAGGRVFIADRPIAWLPEGEDKPLAARGRLAGGSSIMDTHHLVVHGRSRRWGMK